MKSPPPTAERDGRTATVRLHGDLVVPAARALYSKLRTVARRRELQRITLDFADVGRIDSSGVAVVSLIGKLLERGGRQLELAGLADQHKAVLALAPDADAPRPQPIEIPGALEWLGERVLDTAAAVRAFARLAAETVRQLLQVIARRAHLPAGALRHHIEGMGFDAIFIVALLSFLTGMTMGFQGAVQLKRFGAGVFVADMIGMSMVRELVPLMTAVILTGRTGAAIAAELGTMQVRSEIDALSTMGINPVRFLIVPRLVAITIIGPALTLMGIFIGIVGGMLVAWGQLDLSPATFWQRVVERVELLDFAHGLGKSLVFAWIIGLAGSYLGMTAKGDAGSVGTATTRTVVTSVFFIILVDAVFATITTFVRHG